ncbi:TetR/AcrR family transcriptional regulator [Mycobacterium sp.]|uniref:TetR/AcrR family transcriptional regulator n=1 Tax=Mycobacterium sp. TaxID=1785 RepID=UPI003A866D8F
MPKISASSVEEHREQVQQRVFEAFATMMSEHSFEAISMAKLAAAAGIGRTAIYHHFADKEAVVVAFASHETSRYLAGLQQDLAGVTDPTERMRIYVRRQLDTGRQFHMGLGSQLYGSLSVDTMREIRDHVVSVENVLRSILTDGAANGQFVIDDEAATMSLVHACLVPRNLPTATVEHFVLRALGTAG